MQPNSCSSDLNQPTVQADCAGVLVGRICAQAEEIRVESRVRVYTAKVDGLLILAGSRLRFHLCAEGLNASTCRQLDAESKTVLYDRKAAGRYRPGPCRTS